MTVAQGTAKQSRWKRQSAKGALAESSGGQILRREQSTFELAKEAYTTESEITSTQQVKSSRHGVRMVNGSLTGILSAGTYSDQIAALLRRDFAAISAITGLSITIAEGSLLGGVQTYTATRGTGSFLTDGLKVGLGARFTAGTFDDANLNKNLFIVGVEALVLTVIPMNGEALVAEGPIASATLTVPGKVTYTPETGHTKVYYTVEEWYSDVSVSERNKDVVVTQGAISLPGSGNATLSLTAMGLDQTTETSVYFASPTAETSTDALVAAGGVLMVAGIPQAVITELSIDINGNGAAADGVVGSNVRPDIFRGKVNVTGSFTAYFESATTPNLFVNETETSISSAITSGAEADSDFMTFTLSAVKLNSSTPDDGETGLKRVYSFQGTLNNEGGAALANTATTIQVQDSAAA